MRIFAPFLLILGFSFQAGGWYFSSKVGLKSYQKNRWEALEKAIEKENAIVFIFSKAHELQWINSKEILVDGKLYDVIRVEPSGSEIHVSCIRDKKEEEIKSLFDNFLSKASKNKSPSSNKVEVKMPVWVFEKQEFVFKKYIQDFGCSFKNELEMQWKENPGFHPPDKNNLFFV